MDENLLYQQLQKITFSTFLFNIRPVEKLIVGKFYGSTIRGGFGYSFKKIICVFRNKQNCSDCILKNECVYSILFESKLQNKEAGLKTKDIPRPYVIDTYLKRKKIYSQEELFPLNMILIGKSIKYLPYFLLAIQKLGEEGFGYQRKKFIVEEIVQKYPHQKTIYNVRENTLNEPDEGILNLAQSDDTGDELTIKFITPTRVKYNGTLVSIIEFHHLIRSLIHRITFISEHWCDYRIEYDWKNLIKEAEDVKIKKWKTKWFELARYSSRQKTKMNMGGIVGEITYKGNIKEFFPLIKLGSYLHTGKNTTFGLGKYDITCENGK